jgi:hypothetical protein
MLSANRSFIIGQSWHITLRQPGVSAVGYQEPHARTALDAIQEHRRNKPGRVCTPRLDAKLAPGSDICDDDFSSIEMQTAGYLGPTPDPQAGWS